MQNMMATMGQLKLTIPVFSQQWLHFHSPPVKPIPYSSSQSAKAKEAEAARLSLKTSAISDLDIT